MKIKIYAALVLAAVLSAGAGAAEPFWKRIFNTASKRRDMPATVAGVRGLDEADSAGGDAAARNYEALEKIERARVTAEELEKFIADGGLR